MLCRWQFHVQLGRFSTKDGDHVSLAPVAFTNHARVNSLASLAPTTKTTTKRITTTTIIVEALEDPEPKTCLNAMVSYSECLPLEFPKITIPMIHRSLGISNFCHLEKGVEFSEINHNGKVFCSQMKIVNRSFFFCQYLYSSVIEYTVDSVLNTSNR